MKYELAKQLKDAGLDLRLPSGRQRAGLCKHLIWGFEERIGCDCTPEDHAPVPTLSELIEACGDKFDILARYNNQIDYGEWHAGLTDASDGSGLLLSYEPSGHGDTPEEAVAHLLLYLSGGNIKEWMEKNIGIGKGEK